MAKELLIGALRGERVEQTPWLPHIGTHPAQLLGVSAERYLQDAELLARGAVLCAEHYRCDGIPLVDDPQLEAISLGCVPHWSEQGPPSIVSSPLYTLPAEELGAHFPPLPDETTGRWPTVIAAGARAKSDLERRDVALVGLAAGPCTIAYQLRGLALFTDLFRHPVSATRLFAYAGQVSAMCQLHRSLGIPDEDHIIRPLVRRGFSARGMAISLPALEPEVTVNREGVFWHPVATDPDLLISSSIFPVRDSVERIKEIRESMFMVTAGAATRYR